MLNKLFSSRNSLKVDLYFPGAHPKLSIVKNKIWPEIFLPFLVKPLAGNSISWWQESEYAEFRPRQSLRLAWLVLTILDAFMGPNWKIHFNFPTYTLRSIWVNLFPVSQKFLIKYSYKFVAWDSNFNLNQSQS